MSEIPKILMVIREMAFTLLVLAAGLLRCLSQKESSSRKHEAFVFLLLLLGVLFGGFAGYKIGGDNGVSVGVLLVLSAAVLVYVMVNIVRKNTGKQSDIDHETERSSR